MNPNEINLIFNLILSKSPDIFIEIFNCQNKSYFNFINWDYLKKTFLLTPNSVEDKYNGINRKVQLFTFENFRINKSIKLFNNLI